MPPKISKPRRGKPKPLTPTESPTQPAISAQDSQSLLSPRATPPTPSTDLPTVDPSVISQPQPEESSTVGQPQTLDQPQANFSPIMSADDIISKDIVAIADVFATMKKTLFIMTNAFDRLGIQTEQLSSLSLDIKAAEQLTQVRKALDDQITRQKSEIEVLGNTLKTKIKEAVQEKIKSQLYDMVKASIGQKVEEKVRNELCVQIPEDLCQQIMEHRRQILEIKTNLHNSEARRYNATNSLLSSTARLRPLLRPLPTPEQSPTIIVTEDSALNTPVSAPSNIRAPAPTPIKRSTSNSFKGAYSLETVPPTPSPLFPRDLKSLFKLGAEDARKLLQQYGLASGAPSPTTPKPRGLANVNENEGTSVSPDANGETNDGTCHVEDMNKFMAHIGVPFLMIPPPKSQEPQSPTLSPTSRRRMLKPLIIGPTPNTYY